MDPSCRSALKPREVRVRNAVVAVYGRFARGYASSRTSNPHANLVERAIGPFTRAAACTLSQGCTTHMSPSFRHPLNLLTCSLSSMPHGLPPSMLIDVEPAIRPLAGRIAIKHGTTGL